MINTRQSKAGPVVVGVVFKDRDQLARVDAVAHREERSRSYVIRRALEQYLNLLRDQQLHEPERVG